MIPLTFGLARARYNHTNQRWGLDLLLDVWSARCVTRHKTLLGFITQAPYDWIETGTQDHPNSELLWSYGCMHSHLRSPCYCTSCKTGFEYSSEMTFRSIAEGLPYSKLKSRIVRWPRLKKIMTDSEPALT